MIIIDDADKPILNTNSSSPESLFLSKFGMLPQGLEESVFHTEEAMKTYLQDNKQSYSLYKIELIKNNPRKTGFHPVNEEDFGWITAYFGNPTHPSKEYLGYYLPDDNLYILGAPKIHQQDKLLTLSDIEDIPFAEKLLPYKRTYF